MDSLTSIIRYFGYPLIVAGVMGENFGLPVPGELLVLVASSAIVSKNLSIIGIVFAAALGAVIGDHISFLMGRKAGSQLIDFYCRFSLCSAHCSFKVSEFFRRHGPVTLVFVRFIVGVRALAAPAAGMSAMPYRRFALFDSLGSLLWATVITLAGRFLGGKIALWIAGHSYFHMTIGGILAALISAALFYKVWKIKKYGRARLDAQSLSSRGSDFCPVPMAKSTLNTARAYPPPILVKK